LIINYPWASQAGDQFGLAVTEIDTYHMSIGSTGTTDLFCQVSIPAILDLQLPNIPLPPAGPIPLFISNKISLNATMQLAWTPQLPQPWFTVDGTVHTTLGFLCTATGCTGIHSMDFGSPTAAIAGNGALTVKFGPRLDMKFEGLAGIYVAAYAYDTFTGVPNLSPTCFNDQVGLAFSIGLAAGIPIGPFSNLWSLQLAEALVPLYCFAPINPNFAASDPSLIVGTVDPRGCTGSCSDGTGPGQIQFNPDNSLPRYTREGEITGTIHFPSTLATTINFPGSCLDPSNPTTNCPFGLAVMGRTGTALNGGQFGAYEVIDSNGYVYTPTGTCNGADNLPHPCNDILLFGAGLNGYVGPGSGTGPNCGGSECVDGGQLNANCKSASGVNESCAGHTLIVHIWVESNGKVDYSGGGSQNYPEQNVSWFDGVVVGMPFYPAANNWVISSNAASSDWHCTPVSSAPLYNSPCN
jgi:hypothetical protein